MTYTLSIRGESQNSRHDLIPGNEYILGRSDQADIEIEDKKASRKHAQLQFINKLWVVTDNKSTNGLYVDGKKIQTAELRQGNSFAIGNSRFTLESNDNFRDESAQTAAKAVKAPHLSGGLPKWFLPVLVGLVILVALLIGFVMFTSDKNINTDPSMVIKPEVHPLGTETPGTSAPPPPWHPFASFCKG